MIGHIREYIELLQMCYSLRRGIFISIDPGRDQRGFVRTRHAGKRNPRSCVSLPVRCARASHKAIYKPRIWGWFIWRRYEWRREALELDRRIG